MANGYGEIFDKAMAKPLFPGATGYGASAKVGDVVRARQATFAQTSRNARASSARPVGGVNLGTRSQVNRNPFNTFGGATSGGATSGGARAAGGSGPQAVNLGSRSQVNHNPFNTFGGRTHGGAVGGVTTPVSIRPKAQKVTMGPTRNRPRAAGVTPGALKESLGEAGEKAGKVGREPLMKSFKNNKALMIGAGAAVIAGLAMNRRGDGTSSGRSSMTKY
jgi:hypothetical protein